MTIGIWGALTAYMVTATCGLLMTRRKANWRLRFLMGVVAVLPLCQAAVLIRHQLLTAAPASDHAVELVELFVSALCLSAMHILNRESRDRQVVNAKLRLAEAEAQVPSFMADAPPPMWLRDSVSVDVKA